MEGTREPAVTGCFDPAAQDSGFNPTFAQGLLKFAL
jgi:hypothetical protein